MRAQDFAERGARFRQDGVLMEMVSGEPIERHDGSTGFLVRFLEPDRAHPVVRGRNMYRWEAGPHWRVGDEGIIGADDQVTNPWPP